MIDKKVTYLFKKLNFLEKTFVFLCLIVSLSLTSQLFSSQVRMFFLERFHLRHSFYTWVIFQPFPTMYNYKNFIYTEAKGCHSFGQKYFLTAHQPLGQFYKLPYLKKFASQENTCKTYGLKTEYLNNSIRSKIEVCKNGRDYTLKTMSCSL